MHGLIDKTDPKFTVVPATLNGEYLLELTLHKGKLSGFLTVSPGEFKWIVDNSTPAELIERGYDRHPLSVADIRAHSGVVPRQPKGLPAQAGQPA